MKSKKAMKSNASDSDDTLKMSNRNTLAFWIIVWLISVLTIGNLLLTLTIFGVLKLGKGMEYLEVNSYFGFQHRHRKYSHCVKTFHFRAVGAREWSH